MDVLEAYLQACTMKKKVLLMGKHKSGKTSMRSIIFANYLARETSRLGPTLDVEHSHVRFLDNLVLNLWDCGGQDNFYFSYFESQRDKIFRSVAVLIYVFDVGSDDFEKDLDYYHSCLEVMTERDSKNAKIFALVHKMDLVPHENRDTVFAQRQAEIMAKSGSFDISCSKTSIWDETLYKAWSNIVYSLVPNVEVLENHLQTFCEICNADEVVLFERATFLVISQKSLKPHADAHRFEKISNIIKQFKLSCSKNQAQFEGMEVCNSKFTAFIDQFTSNTYVMLITTNKSIYTAATQLNIKAAAIHFEDFLGQPDSKSSSD